MNFIKNIEFMRQVACDFESPLLKDEMIFKMFDEDFIGHVKAEVQKLTPLCEFIDLAQSKNCTLADSVHKWLQMDAVPGTHQKWLKRDEMICKLPALISYSLHPKYKGELLPEKFKEQVKLAIFDNGRGEQRYDAFQNFLQGNGLYGDEDALKNSPEVYWELMTIMSPELAEMALDYLALPASTGPLERVFSMWAYIHNKTRNKLGSSTSEKLLSSYHFLKTNL